MIATIAGGVGAARMLAALRSATHAPITAIVNVGDDDVLHGLHISPDLDTITYTLGAAIDPDRGWGLRDESWTALESLRSYARHNGRDEIGWFQLGDRDLGTHLYRTSRLAQGATLSQVTEEITSHWNLDVSVIPVTNDELRTRVVTANGEVLDFQEYFVRDQTNRSVAEIRFDGAHDASPAPGVMEVLAEAEVIVIAPSNPLVSIDPVLAVPGLREALRKRRDVVVAVSPIVGGSALKGPAARLMADVGLEPSALGVARYYADVASSLVVDTIDADHAADIDALGMTAVVTPSVMSTPEIARDLAVATLGTTR